MEYFSVSIKWLNVSVLKSWNVYVIKEAELELLPSVHSR